MMGSKRMALPEATARLNAVADAGDQQALSNALRECVPLVVAQLEKDGSREALLNLWGTSSNADASSPDTPTVHPLLLSELGKLAGKEMGGEVVHAGLMHTYGYLLSNLKTPFGFKRARYTQPTVELGLGLPKGLLSPRPNNGTLLANLTYVAGGFGLGKSGPGFAGEIGAAGELADTTIKAGERFRLTERILEADGVALLEPFEIRTELVEFGGKKGKDSHWLVYSVWEQGAGKLITAFPAGGWMVKKSAKLGGKSGEIKGKYNVRLGEWEGKRLMGERAFEQVA